MDTREDGPGNAGGIEAMMRKHFRVRSAHRDLGQSKGTHVGAKPGSRDCRGEHYALPKRDVVVVKRDDGGKSAKRIADPVVVHAIQPWED